MPRGVFREQGECRRMMKNETVYAMIKQARNLESQGKRIEALKLWQKIREESGDYV